MIDDEIDSENPLVQWFSASGFAVTCTSSGMEGLHIAVFAPPDAIVLDLHLPDMLGVTVLSELRRRDCRSPVIAITGWYLDGGHEEAVAAIGAAAFLRKPIDADQLAVVIHAVIAAGPVPKDPFAHKQRCHQPTVASGRWGYGRVVDDDVLHALHSRGIQGDSPAIDSLLELIEPYLKQSLTVRFQTVPRDWIHDAAQDALLEYRTRPRRFDPSKGVPLKSFLVMAARRDLLNRMDAERRRAFRASPWDIAVAGLRTVVSPNVDRQLDLEHALRRVSGDMTDTERGVLYELQNGGSAQDLAKAAGVEHFPRNERRAAVKRTVNRILQRLRRVGLRT